MSIIDKLYKTRIDAEDYTVNIDSTISLTFTVLDYNNSPVNNATVVITCDKGQFQNDDDTITLQTNSNGVASVQYTALEWGFVNITANNNSIQLYVTGWKEVRCGVHSYWDDLSNVKCYVDESILKCLLTATYYPTTFEFDERTPNNIGEIEFYNTSEIPIIKEYSDIQSITTTKNSKAVYDVNIDNITGVDWSLELDMQIPMNNTYFCFGNSDRYNIIGRNNNGKLAVGFYDEEYYLSKIDIDWGSDWHHCKISRSKDFTKITFDYTSIRGYSFSYDIYNNDVFIESSKIGTVKLKNIVFEDSTSPYYPATNIKQLWYRPDIILSFDSHGIFGVRSEINAKPAPSTDREKSISFQWSIYDNNKRYISEENIIE